LNKEQIPTTNFGTDPSARAQDKPSRNRIRGMVDWVSKHIFAKPQRITKGQLCRCGRDRMKEDAITWRAERKK
jgi:hypothetical protein